MKYSQIEMARFIDRPNRFIAHVKMADGHIETVHVKNTGRCKELLLPNSTVVLEKSSSLQRKTAYDLIAVYKQADWLFNIDSQAPNKVVGEWLATQDFDFIKPEYTYGKSRVDFYMERYGDFEEPKKYLMEVKGCTLEREGIGYFPDAPTERGVKHLRELAAAQSLGYHCIIAFVIPMEGVYEVRANWETHPEFGIALQEAEQAGVSVLYLPCSVTPDSLHIVDALW